MCFRPRGKDKYRGGPCNNCGRWVHLLCAPHRDPKFSHYTCRKCYYKATSPKRPSKFDDKDKNWVAVYEGEREKSSPVPPPGLIFFDPSDIDHINRAKVNYELYVYHFESNPPLTKTQYAKKRLDLLSKYQLLPTTDSDQLTREEDVEETNVQSKLASDKRKREESATATASHAKRVALPDEPLSFVIVDFPTNSPSADLPFTLVVLPECAPETEEDFFGNVNHLTTLTPRYIQNSTHIDHLTWFQSKQPLTKKNRAWPMRFTQREVLNPDGTMHHGTLMRLMCSILQIKGPEGADDTLDILKRCSDQFQHRIVRLGQSKKKSTNADYIHFLVDKYTTAEDQK